MMVQSKKNIPDVFIILSIFVPRINMQFRQVPIDEGNAQIFNPDLSKNINVEKTPIDENSTSKDSLSLY
jgi:hypothetical protein